MWLITEKGFISVVQKPGDAMLTVRARVREDLEKLLDDITYSLATTLPEGTEIVDTPKADYPFRVQLSRHVLAEVIAWRIRNINYSNFKDTQPERHSVYMDVWVALMGLARLKKKPDEQQLNFLS